MKVVSLVVIFKALLHLFLRISKCNNTTQWLCVLFDECLITRVLNFWRYNLPLHLNISYQFRMTYFFMINFISVGRHMYWIFAYNLCWWELAEFWHSTGGPPVFITMINEILSSACVDLRSASCFSVIHLYIKNLQLYYKTSTEKNYQAAQLWGLFLGETAACVYSTGINFNGVYLNLTVLNVMPHFLFHSGCCWKIEKIPLISLRNWADVVMKLFLPCCVKQWFRFFFGQVYKLY